VEKGKGKRVPNFKYHAGSNRPKFIWLSAAEPSDGADGASVVCVPSPFSLHEIMPTPAPAILQLCA
jgi:hypothetical protein